MKILIVVAHTDDETIGMGGTIARHVRKGDDVFCLAMTDGVAARGLISNKQTKIRQLAADTASDLLGFQWLENPLLPDNALDSLPLLQLVKLIEQAAESVSPHLIYTHSAADLNIDHATVSRAVLTAFRPQPTAMWQEIRCFETASATDYGHSAVTGIFDPNMFINIENTWSAKVTALEAYSEEMRPAPHSRSISGIESLARLRGHQVGVEYAEAFQIIRKIER